MPSLDGLTSATQPFFAACKTRRTCWQLARCPTTADQTILDIVNEAMLHSPSAFNSQSTRMLVLLGSEHEHLWMEIAKPILRVCAPEHVWPMTEKKLEGFASAHGTVSLESSSSLTSCGVAQRLSVTEDSALRMSRDCLHRAMQLSPLLKLLQWVVRTN